MEQAPEGTRYRILDVIGRGGFGTVYRGEAHGSGGFVKEVALKVLHPHVEANPQQLARLREEARMLAMLQHRSIVGVETLTRLNDRWTVVMEYVPGVTVRDLLDRYGVFPLAVALKVAADVASALDQAYRATAADGSALKLLHRDVKPSNLQLTRWGDVKLLDFGIARTELESREVSTGAVVYGSVPYLAPERLAMRDTHQADVYALALTLVQMLTGTLPSPGAPNAERIAHARSLLTEIAASDELVALVVRSLAWDPEDRPDARKFEMDLRRIERQFTMFDVRDWAAEHVGRLLDQRQAAAGELTGMSFVEGSAPTTLQDLFGAKAAPTFDDPVDAPKPAPPPPPPPPPPLPAPDDSGPSNPALPAGPAEPLPMGRPALAPRNGLRNAFAVVIAATTGIGGLLGGGVLVGGIGMLTASCAGVLGALFWSPGMCASFVDTTRGDARSGGYERSVDALLDDAQRSCSTGQLDAWDVNNLSLRIDEVAADGRIDRDELEDLRHYLTALRRG